eukprot:120401_1
MMQVTIIKEGWIEKKGQTLMAGYNISGYKKRWLILYSDKTLKYYEFEDKSCKTLKGSINLSKATKIQNRENSKEHSKNGSFVWEVKTPKRDWIISSQSDNDRKQWIENITNILQNDEPNTDIKNNLEDDDISETNISNENTNESNSKLSDQLILINGLNAALSKQADKIVTLKQQNNELQLNHTKLQMQYTNICDERDQLLDDIKVCTRENKIYKNVINELKSMVREKNEENTERGERLKSVFDLNSSAQKWKTKYFNQNEKIRQLRTDKSNIATEKQRSFDMVEELKDELKHAKHQIKVYTLLTTPM